MARLSIGFVSSVKVRFQPSLASVPPGTKLLGSKFGTETIAKISPVFGSMITQAPRPTLRITPSAIVWMRASNVR